MADTISSGRRSEIMSHIKRKDTGIELFGVVQIVFDGIPLPCELQGAPWEA